MDEGLEGESAWSGGDCVGGNAGPVGWPWDSADGEGSGIGRESGLKG